MLYIGREGRNRVVRVLYYCGGNELRGIKAWVKKMYVSLLCTLNEEILSGR